MKVIAFAATNSTTSINKQLVSYAVSLLGNVEVELLDLNDYEMPLYSEDREKATGHPELAKQFLNKLNDADAIIISFAEHNGSYSVAYKNVFDWCSRIQHKVYQGKPMVLLATSPGAGGAQSVLAVANGSMPYFGAEVKASLSVPNFFDNFDTENQRMINPEWDDRLHSAMQQLLA